MINGGLNPQQAEMYVEEGIADCVAFGVLFIANANLPWLLQKGSELHMGGMDASVWYSTDPEKDASYYTDWPSQE